MTGYISLTSSDPVPLSRLTIATLQDLGYTVDYSSADDFGTSDLNLSVCPLCNGRQLRSVGSRQLGVDEGLTKRRKLPDSLRTEAVQYGLSSLAQQKQVTSQKNGDLSQNSNWIAVLVGDEDMVYSVIVVAQGN